MKISLHGRAFLILSIVTFFVWFPILSFWFNNVDLSYMHSYISIIDPLLNLNPAQIIRGHVLLHLPIYLLFGHSSWAYYLSALILHIISVYIFYMILFYHSKKSIPSVFGGLFFGISIAYSNVLFEGSFNLYYPMLLNLLLLTHLLTLIAEKVDTKYTISMAILFFVGLLLRETAFLLPVVLVLTVFIFKPVKQFKKYGIRVLLPLGLLAIGYLFIRSTALGELKSDLTDDAVQVRISLSSSNRWGELTYLIVVNFFRLISEQVIPYPILYFIREKVANITSFSASQFSLLSGASVVLGGLVLYFVTRRYYKSTWYKLAFFGGCWLIFSNLFISIVMPFPEHVLAQPYTERTVLSRYNYFGFAGLSFLISAFLIQYRKSVALFVSIYIFLSFILIRSSSQKLYHLVHAPARSFYHNVFSLYPSLPQKAIIYYNFFQTGDLKDYIGDLVWILAKKNYPQTSFTLETTASHVQNELANGNYKIDQLLSFDLDSKKNFLDKTAILRSSFSPQIASVESNKKASSSASFIFPEVFLSSKTTNISFEAFINSESQECSPELADLMVQREVFSSDSKVNTSSLYGDYPRFYFINAQNLTDAQFFNDFYWQADITDSRATVTVDLGEQKKINGFAWESVKNSHGIPYSYTISVSNDQEEWLNVAKVEGNQKSGNIDYFPPQKTKFVRMEILTTSLGQPPVLLEVRAGLFADNFREKWTTIRQAEAEVFNSGCRFKNSRGEPSVLSKISTSTDAGSTKEYNQILSINRTQSYKIPVVHLETISGSRQILEEQMEQFSITLNGQNSINLNRIVLEQR